MNLISRMVGCRKCPAFKNSGRVLPPWGDTNSKIMIIGQSACVQCIEAGEPFYGYSGIYLDQACDICGVRKEELLITNCLLHNPENNRPSKQEEIQSCFPFTEEIFHLLKPKVVITLGRDSHNIISRTGYSIKRCLESKVWFKSDLCGRPVDRFIWIPEVHPSFYYRMHNSDKQRLYASRLGKKLKYALRYTKRKEK